YWFNPLLWLIRKQLQNLRELCCDATVAKILKEKTFSYRETLLKTARQLLAEPVDPGLGLLGLFENSNWLVERLKWLERKTWKNRGLRIASIFVLVCLMATCVIPMAKFDPGLPGLTIKGRVTDTATGEPIAGARIYDDPYGPGPDWQKIERGFYAPNLPQWGAITDANGEYAFLTWHEHHSFKVEAKGYEPDRGTLYSSHFSIPTKDIEVFDFALKKGEGETDVEVNAVVGGVDSSDSIGRVNLPVGTRGVVTGKHGDAIYGSDIKYSPLMYLGRVNKDQGIELVDRNIYYSQHTIPIVKVRVLNKLYAAVSVGTVGWVSLACTDFYKAFEQKSDGELPGRFKELKKERRKGTVSSAQDHLSSKVSKKLVEVFGEQERGERSEVSLDDDVVTGDGNIDDSIGKINKPTGTNGVVVSEYGSTMFGSDIKYSSLMHLGDVRKGQRIELVDSKVYYNQFTIPIVKVKVLNKLYASVPVGTAGWVTLADTDFYKWFMQKSDEELPSHFKKLKKERKKRSLALAEERRAKKASSGEPVEVLEVGQDGQSGAEYKAALPNGAVVELVGVCEHPSESKQWWKPDGELIDLPYEVGGKIIGPSEGYQMLDLIAEITTKEQNPAVKFITPGAIRSSTGRNVVINQMNVSDLWSYRFKIDSILKTADVKAGVASGEWKTISTIISSFKNLQRNDTDLGQVEWLKAIEENDEVIIYASNNFSDKAQFRIVAEDVIGRIYPAYTSDCKGNAGLMSCEYKFHLSPKKAKKFLFQTRPYEWTEFKNVSLKPNFKTDVQIEGE
ncbi:MAG: hypothetical protein KAS96_07455, partial [Planctomycetes bacterium]|nr:hypothetical protein [Planctomycetota bacterium]